MPRKVAAKKGDSEKKIVTETEEKKHKELEKDEEVWAEQCSEHDPSGSESESGSGSEVTDSESDYEEPEAEKERDIRKPKTVRPLNTNVRRPRSEAMNFDFRVYDEINLRIVDASTIDLMRAVLVRAHRAGQRELKKFMETGLKALNHECAFPERQRITSNTTGASYNTPSSYGTQSYGSYRFEEQPRPYRGSSTTRGSRGGYRN